MKRANLLVLLMAGCSLSSMPLPAFATQSASTGKFAGDVNAALTSARADNKDKRFADAEALMLPITTSQPALILPWIELGNAQIGLQKYADAEKSFKIALGIDPATLKQAQGDDFFAPEGANSVAPEATRASRNTAGGTVTNAQTRSPEIKGVSYASLGEIFIKTGRPADAEKAYDAAVQAYPQGAALYRGNETIFFFQTGNADGQLLAAEQAIKVDPARAILYYFKAQALAGKATVDPKTQKMILPPGCADAYRKYLQLDPKGQFSADAKGVLNASGLSLK